jgi:Transposase DDE domain
MHPSQKQQYPQQKHIAHHAQKTNAYTFFNILTSPRLLDIVEQQQPAHRERLYTPTTTLSLFLAQAMNTDASCQNTVNRHAVERVFNGLSACSTTTGAYCKARARLPQDMVAALVKQTGRLILEEIPTHWRWQGRRVKLVDGTTITLPDTAANQHVYPQQHGQQPGLGFPVARMVGIVCLASGAILHAAMGAYKGKGASEHALLRQLMDGFEAGDVVLADRYYCSYFMIALFMAKGADVVFQQHAMRKTDFRTGQRLSTRDHIVAWQKPKIIPAWMTPSQYDAFPNELTLRELKSNGRVLVTTLLSDKTAPKTALTALYKQRWHVELDLRNIKTVLGMDTLHCKTPAMNEKEMWVYFLAYNLIRLLIAASAAQANLFPRQISFKHALQVWLIWHNQPTEHDKNDPAILLMLIAQQRVGNRPGRIEPRCLKRRPKAYPLLSKSREEARLSIINNGHPKKLK